VCYGLLLLGGCLFLFPFVWLVSTSLKPNEQATSMPPRWVPYDYHTETDGEYVQVIRGEPLKSPMLIVRIDAGPTAGTRTQVGTDEFADGKLKTVVGGITTWVPATLLRRAEPGWYYVEERRDDASMEVAARWDLVPPDKIDGKPHLFWSNFPHAIRNMGEVRVWVPLAGEYTIPIFWIYLRNTLLVCGLGVIGAVSSAALVGYSLARIRWRGRGALFALTLATMMVPFPVLMVPLYTLFKTFGWIGSLKPLWVPAFFGSGFNIFLLRQFFLTIPRDLSEAARIDGCSEFGIFWRIILPLSRPALAVVALFHFLYAWNDFMGPLLYLTREETFTLSLGLQSFQSKHGGTDWTGLMAASTLFCLPIIVLFFFTQKTFIKGIATTGLKG
jgi:multiple sugar transport system permease protein